MLLSLAKLSHYGFNQRALTIEDFYTICDSEKIKVLEKDIDSSFFMTFMGNKFIVLSRKMTELKQRYVAFHELHHAMLGSESQNIACFFGLDDTPEEREANAFAAVAIIPRHSVGDVRIVTECCCGYGRIIYDERMRIFATFGI